MPYLRRMHITLLVLALVNMLPAIEVEESWGVFAIAVAAAVLSCAYYWKFGKRPFPAWIRNVFVIATAAFLLYEMFYPHDEPTVHILDLSHFIAFLCCCKFFELRTYRDAGLIVLISFLLMVISSLVSASPYFAFALLVDMTIGIAWLMEFHSLREGALVKTRAAIASHGLVVPRSESDPPSGPSVLRPTAFYSFVLLIVAASIFVIAPRGWRGGIFGRIHGLMPRAVTGFSDIVRLTSNEITEDLTPIMRVRFSLNGEEITDEDFACYMRGYTFSRYRRGWRRTPTAIPRAVDAGTVDEPARVPPFHGTVTTRNLVKQEVWLDSIGNGVLFARYPPIAFGSPDIKDVQVDGNDLALQTPASSRKSAHYVVFSPERTPPAALRILSKQLRDPGRSDVPRRVFDLAQTFLPEEGGRTDEAVALSIRDYLLSDRFSYTLKRGFEQGSRDPVENFLFDNRQGHCEYFASAMAVLCQSVGIPARLVSGYHGGEYNHSGGFFQFRSKDAHAWVEVFLEGKGWTVFDPTPAAATASRRRDDSMWAGTRRLVDFLQFKWSALVVSFDADNRRALGDRFQLWFSGIIQGDGEAISFTSRAKAFFWGPEVLALWQRILYWLLLVLCTTLVVLALRVLWILSLMAYERLPAQRSSELLRQVDARFYDRLIRLLAHKGHIKPDHVTPREFAQWLARSNRDFEPLPAMIEWFYAAQFGRQALESNQRDTVRAILQRLREDPSFGAA